MSPRRHKSAENQTSAQLIEVLAQTVGATEADLPALRALARGTGDDFKTRARLLRPQRPNNLTAQLAPLSGIAYALAMLGDTALDQGDIPRSRALADMRRSLLGRRLRQRHNEYSSIRPFWAAEGQNAAVDQVGIQFMMEVTTPLLVEQQR